MLADGGPASAQLLALFADVLDALMTTNIRAATVFASFLLYAMLLQEVEVEAINMNMNLNNSFIHFNKYTEIVKSLT